ncbi:hypothetical protein M23134_06969 [Microscilla marina ATCC 23134]|uniref:Uncharacterized protein n=1 Tax=Microscilla marina ATCC 23134 TaxID=313606 RepID=A1ZYI2_MICM2|nr:hypothetical protein M23134_06969 [Microscilla marina ATCC 23134]
MAKKSPDLFRGIFPQKLIQQSQPPSLEAGFVAKKNYYYFFLLICIF